MGEVHLGTSRTFKFAALEPHDLRGRGGQPLQVDVGDLRGELVARGTTLFESLRADVEVSSVVHFGQASSGDGRRCLIEVLV